MAYLDEDDVRSLSVRFSRGVSLAGVLGSRAHDIEVELYMEDISLYFRLIDAFALAYENRVVLRGNGDVDANRLSREV